MQQLLTQLVISSMVDCRVPMTTLRACLKVDELKFAVFIVQFSFFL